MKETPSLKTEANELERLRDILYGERVRSIEDRLDEIDQRIGRNTSEINRRIDHEVEELGKRLDSMNKRFDERLLSLQTQQTASLNANVAALNDRLDEQAASQTAALDETRAALQQDSQTLKNDLRAWRERIGQLVSALGSDWTNFGQSE
jgi:tetrahydromethanopterin S-methyltransferase subunit G